MGFTKDQQLAIETQGTNILVAAGAGSGKTTVLSARVIHLLKQGVSIDDLIILTFTNAAAAEMKQRIKENIEKNPDLHFQLPRLENAKISTFDSFCLNLVKQYHYLLDIPESIEIADKILWESLQDKLLVQTLDAFYQSKEDGFIKVIDRFFDKSDETFKIAIRTLSKALKTIPEPMKYLDNLEAMMFSDASINRSIDEFKSMIESELTAFKSMYHQAFIHFESITEHPKVSNFMTQMQAYFNPLLNAQSFDALILAFNHLAYPRLPSKSVDFEQEWVDTMKSWFAPLKDKLVSISKYFDHLYVSNTEDIRLAMLETLPSVRSIITVTKQYYQTIQTYQKASQLYDFNDIMHLAISLLINHEDIRLQLKNKTHEIMVDEYQDTNDLQEYLVSLIQNNNVFMVGDAKQSIYGFRDANPENFIRKYHDFSKNHGGVAIPLFDNFRSRKEVLDGINTIFYRLMNESLGGIDYQAGQSLIYKNTRYEQTLSPQMHYEPEIMAYYHDKESPITVAEMEATLMAKTILQMLDQQTRVVELNEGHLSRLASYRDFCILVDRKTDFPIYESILLKYGIPTEAQVDESFVASTEILFITQWLKLMFCYKDETYFKHHFRHAFYGVARSFVYQIDDEAIITLLLNHSFQTWRDLEFLKNNPLWQGIDQSLRTLSNQIDTLTIRQLMTSICEEIHLYESIHRLPNPANVEKKLDFLFSKVASFRRFDFYLLMDYFDEVYQNKDLDIEYSQTMEPNTDAVRLMTMHKAKGLEFPFCFYPGLDKRFNLQEFNQFTLFSSQYGLILKSQDQGFKDTIWHKLYKYERLKKEISERIRLFYVALTRAKEKIFILYNLSNETESFDLEYHEGYLSDSIRMALTKYRQFIEICPSAKAWMHLYDPTFEQKTIIREPFIVEDTITIPFRYRFIESKKMDLGRFSKKEVFVKDETTLRNLEEGTKLHRIMETIDFSNLEDSLLNLNDEHKQMVIKLINHPVLKDLHRAKIYQEYPFIETNHYQDKKGIIDLLLVYDDHIDIIDYKLRHLEDEAYLSQLEGYRNHLKSVSNLPIYLYLYSLSTHQMTQIGGSL